MGSLIVFVMLAMSIERLADLLSGTNQLEGLRGWFERTFPRVKRLATCKFCQTFWLSGMVGVLVPFPLLSSLLVQELALVGWLAKSAILWLSLFWMALFLDEFLARYLNRAPFGVFLHQEDAKDE